jgi:hypothetical protein
MPAPGFHFSEKACGGIAEVNEGSPKNKKPYQAFLTGLLLLIFQNISG